MNERSNKNLTKTSQILRKEMTKEERKLWYDFLKHLPVNFNRQKVISRYIVDFYSSSAKLVIELDGSQHYEKENMQKDVQRTAFLKSLGLKVLRYSNLDVLKNFNGVCKDILNNIIVVKENTSPPSLTEPPLKGKP